MRFSAKTLCFFSFHIFGWRDTEFPIIEYILYSKCYLYLYIVTLKMMSWLGVYIPGTCLSPILGLQPSKTRSFPIKTGVVWVPGMHINIYLRLPTCAKFLLFQKKTFFWVNAVFFGFERFLVLVFFGKFATKPFLQIVHTITITGSKGAFTDVKAPAIRLDEAVLP